MKSATYRWARAYSRDSMLQAFRHRVPPECTVAAEKALLAELLEDRASPILCELVEMADV